MTNRKERILWILYGIVLIALFLVSSTDLIIKEKRAEVYPVSVIIEDTSDDYYVNFRRGMERAAMELNADVSFITLYEQGNRAQQADMVLRELEDGTRALIVSPVDEEMIMELQSAKQITDSLVLLNTEKELITGEGTAAVTSDYYQIGCELGERLLKEQPPSCPVYLFSCRGHDPADKRIAEGLYSMLEPAGVEVKQYYLQKPDGMKLVLSSLTETMDGEAVVAALDPESLTAAAQLLADGENCTSWIRGLYGRGTTVPLLNYLDRGVIQALCITDDFSAGYVSVETVVELMNGRSVSSREDLKGYCIGRDELRAGTYEKMLYPIE